MAREVAPQPRTVLEAIKVDRAGGWRAMARLVAEKTGRRFDERSIERVGTGFRSPGRDLARALETAFSLPIDTLLGPYDPAVLPIPAAGVATHQETLAMAAKKTRNVGLNMPDLDSYSFMEEELRDLARAYPVTPLHELINPLVDLQDSVLAAVTNPTGHGDGRRLYGIAAITGGLLAKASHDYGRPRDAVTQIRTALMFSDQIRHDALKGWLNGLLSLVSYWDAAPRHALESAQRGLASTSTGSTALWLHSSAARAHARMGNVEETTAAVRRAEEIAETMEASELDDIGGLMTFTHARARYYYADAYAWLPGHGDGERIAEQAVEAYANPDAEDWAFGDAAGASCDLAIIRIHNGDIEGARAAVSTVLDLPREQRIGGIIKSVERVGAALATVPASPIRDDLRDELEAYTRAPMEVQP